MKNRPRRTEIPAEIPEDRRPHGRNRFAEKTLATEEIPLSSATSAELADCVFLRPYPCHLASVLILRRTPIIALGESPFCRERFHEG